MGAGEVLVRRCDIALLPMMQGSPGASFAPDPQHLDGGHWGLLDPLRLRAHERVRNILEDGSDVLGKRHVGSSALDWNRRDHDKPPHESGQGEQRGNPVAGPTLQRSRKRSKTASVGPDGASFSRY